MTARAFAVRLSAAYALLMMGTGVQLPFLPLWLKTKGLDASAVAVVVAGMMAVRTIGSPVFSWVADHLGNRRVVIQLCAGVAVVAYLFLATSEGIVALRVGALAAAFFFSPVFPLVERFGVDGAAAHGLDYGRLRLWASLSFLTGSLVSGALLTWLAPAQAIWLIAVAQGLAFLATLILPPEPSTPSRPQAHPHSDIGARQLLFGSSFPLLLLASGLGQASHAMLYTASSLHWTHLGFDSFDIGVFWACAVLAEVCLFAVSSRVVHRFGPTRLLLAGLGGGVVRWAAMAFFTSYSATLFAQLLHVLSFAATHLGTMHFIRLMTPPKVRNRAQGLYSALASGLLMSTVAWASGHLYRSAAGQAYWAMSLVSLTALVLAGALVNLSSKVRAAGAA